MKSTESDVCHFEVDAVFNREPVSYRMIVSYRIDAVFVGSVPVQSARSSLSLQQGAVPAVGPAQRRRLHQVSPPHGRSTLPLLRARLLPRPQQTHDALQGLPM